MTRSTTPPNQAQKPAAAAPWERQRASAELQRHGEDAHAKHQRKQRGLDESDPVSGEQLGERGFPQQRAITIDPLGTEQCAQRADDEKPDNRGPDQHAADHLVIAGGNDAHERWRSSGAAHRRDGVVRGGFGAIEGGFEGAHG